jgi:hypothetical protein
LIAVDGFGLDFSAEDRTDGGIDLRKEGWLRDWDIVCAEDQLNL